MALYTTTAQNMYWGKILLIAFLINSLNKPSMYLVDTLYESIKTIPKQHIETTANNFKNLNNKILALGLS